MSPSPQGPQVAVIGAGPAGLMAAEILAAGGARVDVYDAMPSVGRKFLLAGRGGLNLTHAEPVDPFVGRYAHPQAQAALSPMVRAFDGQAVRDWAQGLGIDTFVGTSSRVFPTDLKAAPLLRAWLHRLRQQGVRFHMRHRWQGWTDDGALRLLHGDEEIMVRPDATVLALGGASWARLGSDGAWVPWLQSRGIEIAMLQAANCGFDVAPTRPDASGWSTHLSDRFAGQPIKPVALTFTDLDGQVQRQQGEFVLTATGVEGSLIYAFSGRIRDTMVRDGQATIWLDLLPSHTAEQVLAEVSRPRGPRSLSTHLKSRLGLQGLKMALLHELLTPEQLADARQLAEAIKALPLTLLRPRPIDEAISTAGGVRFDAMDEHLMLQRQPGVFCAGEMLDWEAPTGGYLLTACLATGRHAAQGLLAWWSQAKELRTSAS
ncbi:MAG TPA: TIGR03862 family flavoprotein [Aquabacterium sp.]|uniref:TIGR03862 family flavoprotein n=1 Tax=Aquabacterium sp. TaxID=1872578 RepID=UPI002E32036B|nr:TIGR03862 family flavoprotein [Aquabacterium sp.]HEX5373567.1 TIGR03862 family flavoprotein [Aquabacterium sp.]